DNNTFLNQVVFYFIVNRCNVVLAFKRIYFFFRAFNSVQKLFIFLILFLFLFSGFLVLIVFKLNRNIIGQRITNRLQSFVYCNKSFINILIWFFKLFHFTRMIAIIRT